MEKMQYAKKFTLMFFVRALSQRNIKKIEVKIVTIRKVSSDR